MSFRTNTIISALAVMVALLIPAGSNARAGESGAHPVAPPKKVPTAAAGPSDKPPAKPKHDAPPEPEHSAHEAAQDAGGADGADAAAPAGDEFLPALPPPPTLVDEPPASPGEARHPHGQPAQPEPPSEDEQPLLERFSNSLLLAAVGVGGLLVLLAAAASVLVLDSLRRSRALMQKLAAELRIAHLRMETLVQQLERPTPALVGAANAEPQLPAAVAPSPERKQPRPVASRNTSRRPSATSREDLPLLRLLLRALDRHGLLNATGSHIEVDLQHLDTSQLGIAAPAELEARLSHLNFVAATSEVKPLREQNFLSIASKRSGADNVPRRIVRVHQEAVPELRTLAFGA